MLNSDYTSSTVYSFSNPCCETEVDSSFNTVGVYPQNKMNSLLNGRTDKEWVQFFIPEIKDIPDAKPGMEGIVSVHSCIDIISQRVIKTPVVTPTTINGAYIPGSQIPNSEGTNLTGKKLIIEGILKQKLLYTSAAPDQAVHSASYSVPFSVFIIISEDTPMSQQFNVRPYIEDIYACKLSDRSFFKNTTIFIKASTVC